MITTIMLLFKKWWIFGLVILALCGIIAIQESRINSKNERIEGLRAQLVNCADANKASQLTIGSMQVELSKAEQTCATRIASKDKLINQINKIRNLKGGAKNVKNSNSVASDSDDALDMLRSMFAPAGN